MEQLKKRTYALEAKEQGQMTQVNILASDGEKYFEKNTKVVLDNQIANRVGSCCYLDRFCCVSVYKFL